jgi:hypothetical protein
MAKSDFALSAKTRVIRETDAELWEQFMNIEKDFADEDEAAREAAHSRGHFHRHDSSRHGRLGGRRQDLPYRENAQWEASVRRNHYGQ